MIDPKISLHSVRGCGSRDCMQSVLITTKVVSSNPTHAGCSIQQYVIKFVSDLRQDCGFLRVLRFPPSVEQITTI